MDDPDDGAFHAVAGFSLFALSLLGTAAHVFIIYSNVSHLKALSSFALFTLAKSSIVGLISLMFLLWCSPITLLGKVWIWKSHSLGWIIGLYPNCFYYVAVQLCQFLQSLNRLVAVIYTRRYNIICSPSNSLLATLLLLVISATWTVIWGFKGYSFTFDEETFTWSSDPDEINEVEGLQNLLLYVIGTTAATVVLDSFTFGKMVWDTKINRSISTSESSRRIKRNNIMFAQKVIEDILFLIDVINFVVIAYSRDDRLWNLIFTSGSWVSVSLLDGIVVILFSRAMEGKRTFRKPKTLTISVIPRSKSTNIDV